MRLTYPHKFQGCKVVWTGLCPPAVLVLQQDTMRETTDDVATIDIELAKTLITTIVRPARDLVSYQHAETDILAFLKLSVILYGR